MDATSASAAPPARREDRWLLFLLAAGAIALVVSGIRPHDRFTWFLEVVPIFIGVPILLATRRRFPLTPLLYILIFNQVQFYMGFLPGIKAFTAAVLGGIGNVIGAAIGGLILGVLEQVGPNLFLSGFGIPSPNQLKDVIAFTVLVLVLIFRPNGLLGRKENV